MIRFATAALAALCLVAAAAGDELKIHVTSFPPGQELRPGVAVLLSVSGLEPDCDSVWHPPGIEGDELLRIGDGHQQLFGGVSPGPRTFVVQVPGPGPDQFAVLTFQYGDHSADPPMPPTPRTAAGVLIIEEQHSRTAAQGRIMDDPIWQTAAKAAGLTWAIEDKDGKQAQRALTAIGESKLELPVVCLIDGDGAVIEVRGFPESVEEMRALIGGAK